MVQAIFTRFTIVHVSQYVSSPLEIITTLFEVFCPNYVSVRWSVMFEAAKRPRLYAMRYLFGGYSTFVACVVL